MNKLLSFQSKVESIKKDSKNPFFKSSYLSLNGLIDAIKPLLEEFGLVLIQPLTNVDGRPAIRSTLLDGEIKLIDDIITLPDLQDPQKMGSAITYYRRYFIQSMLLLQAEDDDGNYASKKEVKLPVIEINKDKEKIAMLLQLNTKENLVSAKDFKDACFNITGFPLEEKHYQDIINSLN